MKTQTVEVLQGTPEWLAHRRQYYNASDAPAMMGLSPYKSRNDLLRERAIGITPEIDEATQARFDRGHEFEAIARPWAEEIVEAELYPVVLSGEVDGLPLSASLDGLTMAGDILFEHKTLNAEIAATMDVGLIPEQHKPQLEQCLMLSGAQQCLFMASNGDRETMRHAWYLSDTKLRAQLIAGWKQFDADVANHQHVETAAMPEGKAPQALPALRIELTGMVTASNLAEFKAAALSVIGAVRTDLQTDNDFADAEKAIKWAKDVEDRLDAAKQHALSQTASIDELFRTLDEIKDESRRKRLDLEKLVKFRKESVRVEIQQAAVNSLRAHYEQINATFNGRIAFGVPADFRNHVADAMKGKKSITSLRDAADTALASAKIKASQDADRARLNLNTLDAHSDHLHLFPDQANLVITKAPDDFKSLVTARIAEHKAKEEKRLADEREKIRREEEARANREAEASRERIRAEEQAKAQAEQAARAESESAKDQRGKTAEATHAMPKATAMPPRASAAITPPVKTRPTDSEIISVLAIHYRVHEFNIVQWLMDMDFESVVIEP